MAITNKELGDRLGFTALRGSKDMIKPVGDDIIYTVSKAHVYLNGAHLINIEFINIEFLEKYLQKVTQAKRKTDAGARKQA